MKIFLNEKCLAERSEFEDVIPFLHSDVVPLIAAGVDLFTRKIEFKRWQEEWANYLGPQEKWYLNDLLAKLEESPAATNSFAYFFLRHHAINLNSDNIISSSLAFACDKIIEGGKVAAMNIPVSPYCGRPFIPMLRSPYNPTAIDVLARVPCFYSKKELQDFLLLEETVFPALKGKIIDFSKFSVECKSYLTQFDHETWEPNTSDADRKLIPANAFPASANLVIKGAFTGLQIDQTTYGDNVAKYMELGTSVACLHGYIHNPRISRKYSRTVFEGGRGRKKLLVSLDTENGRFEVIDFSGTHIGIYDYAGEYIDHYTNQKKIDEHSFHGLTEDLFLI